MPVMTIECTIPFSKYACVQIVGLSRRLLDDIMWRCLHFHIVIVLWFMFQVTTGGYAGSQGPCFWCCYGPPSRISAVYCCDGPGFDKEPVRQNLIMEFPIFVLVSFFAAAWDCVFMSKWPVCIRLRMDRGCWYRCVTVLAL